MEKLQLRQSSFSDEVIAAFVKASGENKVAKVGNLAARAIADACRFHLKKLDLSFCRNLDDSALGTIVDNCSSLLILKIFGCSQVTDLFIKGLIVQLESWVLKAIPWTILRLRITDMIIIDFL